MRTKRYKEFEVSLMLPSAAGRVHALLQTYSQVVVGVDPGEQTGMAFCCYHEHNGWNIRFMTTMTPFEAVAVLASLLRDTDIVVGVEDATLRQHYGADERLIYKKLRSGYRLSANELNQYKGRLIGAGYVKAWSSMIIETLAHNKVKVVRLAPGFVKTKVDKDAFKRITGYDKRSNSHERDAAMIAMLPLLRQPQLFDTDEIPVLR